MIPKIIHYCWLSDNPIPASFQGYIKSWKEKMPDYQMMLWNFKMFDRNSSLWVKQAFDNKKYAFAADYIRLYALYNYGGFYLDMDVEALKSFNPFLSLKTAICYEHDGHGKLEMAAFGVEPKSEWVKKCLDYYVGRSFIKDDGSFDMKVIPEIANEILLNDHYQLMEVTSINDAITEEAKGFFPVFSPDFFSPKSYVTNKIILTENTVSIHHFASSWMKPTEKIKLKLWNFIKTYCPRIASLVKQFFKQK